MDNYKDILIKEAQKITTPQNIQIIELSARRIKGGLNIKLVIDKIGGVTIGDCERITKLLNDRLTILKPIDVDNYYLQVSSPGLDRVFKDIKEYSQFSGRKVKIILSEPLNEVHKDKILKGTLQGVKEQKVRVKVDGSNLEIPLKMIQKTKLDG